MKLEDHVEKIRIKVEEAVKNTLDRCGITMNGNTYAQQKVNGISIGNVEQLVQSIQSEKSEWIDCFDEIVDDYAFTLFNRLACMKVLEAHGLYPEMITQRQQHSGKSYAHYMWLENNQQYRDDAFEGLGEFINYQFEQLSLECDLFNTTIPLHMIPTATFIKEIIDLINAIDEDDQIEEEVWKQGNILSQIYEIYNNSKKAALKASGDKVEYDKVHVQSQIYTPEWVVKFLVDNSLGKLYLEMYPDSEIKDTHKIIGDFSENTREIKPLDEVKVIDPCVGSGNFLLYCFDLFYDLYMDQIENYGADYNSREVPQIIIEKNLHGVDLDERAVQLTKVGLFIKAKTKRNSVKINHYNVVSASFRLPDYKEIGNLFDAQFFSKDFSDLLQDVWKDLQQAHKFGSLLRIDEKFEDKKKELKEELGDAQLSLFTYEKAVEFDLFANNFYEKLGEAINTYAIDDKKKFMARATSEAMTFLKIVTETYDVVASNPPYTDSADMGEQLHTFLNDNYKTPMKFIGNLYVTFYKRNYEFLNKNGFVAMIHPLTFMYLPTYKDMRVHILNNTSIEVFVDYGLSNLFGLTMVDPAFYVLRKNENKGKNLFISLDQYTRTPEEKYKKRYCLEALDSIVENISNKNVVCLDQSKFKKIEDWPFIYNVSDELRNHFAEGSVERAGIKVAQGMATSSNERFVRLWWEISSTFENPVRSKWFRYSKGGPYCKWYGNNWAVLNWENDGAELRAFKKAVLRNQDYYLKKGITYTGSGSKGTTFRIHSENSLFDVGGSCVFPTGAFGNLEYIIAFMNSRLAFYLIDCLNPTVNTQVGDLKRVPFVKPSKEIESKVSDLATKCIELKKKIDSNYILNGSISSPLAIESTVTKALLQFIANEILSQTNILIYEQFIDQEINDIYDLSESDIARMTEKMGVCAASIPVYASAWEAYCEEENCVELCEKINTAIVDYDDEQIAEIKEKIRNALFSKTNELEDFCKNNQINPITVWYFIAHEEVLPMVKARDLIFEWFVYAMRDIIANTDDGIIGINNTDMSITQLLEEYADNMGINSAQLLQMEEYLGRKIRDFMEKDFFIELMNYTNVFMYLPKTPFIWHLSSGNDRGFEAMISIYKWNSDSLYKLKSNFIYKRREKLEYRKTQIAGNDTAQALEEKELIDRQLAEIDDFVGKIDELIASGYNPTLDDGVGKNIAPLQERKMLKADVLNANQLKKYLKAEW